MEKSVKILAGVLTSLAVVLAGTYLWTEFRMDRQYAQEERTVLITSRPVLLEEGERLAQVFGCFRGCHGPDMAGKASREGLLFGRAVAPSLTASARELGATELEAIVRQGVWPDGTSRFVMPSGSFATMTDQDLGAILGFIRHYPDRPSPVAGESTRLYVGGRLALLLGMASAAEAATGASPAKHAVKRDEFEHGKYLARNACSPCHGRRGEIAGHVASLRGLARNYDRQGFGRLLIQGIGLADVVHEVESGSSTGRFSKLKGKELDALFTFLKAGKPRSTK